MAAVTSGTVYSGYQWHSRVYVSWSKTGESIEKNETYISWTAGIHVSGGDQWYNNAVKINATYINGVKVFSGGTYSTITSNGHHAKASGTATIPHNGDGTKSFSASISGWFYSYGNTSTGSGTFELPSIPRVSDLSVNKTSVPADGSTTVTATATKKATAFTDVLTVSLGNYSKTITSGTAFTIPMEWNNAISGTSAVATVKVETFNGTTSIGSKTADLTVTVPESVVPVINDLDISEAVAAVTSAFGNRYVQNLSQLNVSVDASGAYGSTIRSYSTTLDGVNYIQQAFTSNVMKTAGTLDIAVKVTDSRGRTAEDTFNVAVIEYVKPTITSMVYAHCDSDGTQNSSGENTKVTIAGKVYPVENQNTKALKLKYKSTADEVYTERVVTLSDWTFSVDVIIAGTDPSVTYEYIAELTDKINADSPETFRVTTGIVVMSRLAGGKGVTMFGEAKDEGFIVEGSKPSSFTGNMFVAIDEETQALCEQTLGADILDYMYPNGEIPEIATDEGIRYLIDCMYPVGRILETTSADDNPNECYSWQTWERYGNGRVTVGVDELDGDFGSVELELGEKEHQLAVDEMPSHQHYLALGAAACNMSYGSTKPNAVASQYAYNGAGIYYNQGENYLKGYSSVAAGGDLAHNNIQPSITVYRWRRIA